MVTNPVEQSPVDDHAATESSVNERHSNTNACVIGPAQPANGTDWVASVCIIRLTAEMTDSHGDITIANPAGFAIDGESSRHKAMGSVGVSDAGNAEWFAVSRRMMR